MKSHVALLAAATVASTVACDDPFDPTYENVAGTYTVQTLTTRDNTGTHNLIAAGATLQITLTVNGGVGWTNGHLFVPGGAAGGSDLDVDLSGNWFLHGDTVYFAQSVMTFVNGVAWFPGRDRLFANQTFSNARFTVALAKQ